VQQGKAGVGGVVADATLATILTVFLRLCRVDEAPQENGEGGGQFRHTGLPPSFGFNKRGTMKRPFLGATTPQQIIDFFEMKAKIIERAAPERVAEAQVWREAAEILQHTEFVGWQDRISITE
jgi:hypothetical protein